jgi:hypothetical protein
VTSDQSPCLDRLLAANRALKALDAAEKDDTGPGLSVAVINAKIAYKRLYDHQNDADLTLAQMVLIQTALELLRVKLRTLGHRVRRES